jgi:hypothetical protein
MYVRTQGVDTSLGLSYVLKSVSGANLQEIFLVDRPRSGLG